MRQWFESLAKREQVLVVVAAVLSLVTGIYIYVFEPVVETHELSSAAVERKVKLLADADRVIARRGVSVTSQPSGPASQNSLTLIVANTANNSGLGTAYKSSSPTSTDGIRVNFENASFDDLVRWLGILASAHNLRVTQARMTDRSDSGRVDASFVLQRG